jgi:serine/threonine protein kinase
MAFYLGWEQCLKIALSVANGFAYLHSKWWKKTIIHCNLQPSNILLDESFEAQLSDLRYCVRSNLKKFLLEESEACYISPGWWVSILLTFFNK